MSKKAALQQQEQELCPFHATLERLEHPAVYELLQQSNDENVSNLVKELFHVVGEGKANRPDGITTLLLVLDTGVDFFLAEFFKELAKVSKN
jgi:hypothetical protein